MRSHEHVSKYVPLTFQAIAASFAGLSGRFCNRQPALVNRDRI
jgi:hypothetical protein